MPSLLAVLGVSPSTPWGSHPEPPRLPQTPSTPAYPDKDRRTDLLLGEAGAPSGCSKTDSPNEYLLLSVFDPQSQLTEYHELLRDAAGHGFKEESREYSGRFIASPEQAGAGDAVPSKVSRGAPRAYSGRFEELFGSPCHSFSRASLWLARSPAHWTERPKHKGGTFIQRARERVRRSCMARSSAPRFCFAHCFLFVPRCAGRKTCSPLNNHPYPPMIGSRFRILKNEERKTSSCVPHFPDPRSRFRFQIVIFSYYSFFLLPFSSLGTTIAPLSVQILNR